jgi:hypothetical protein
VRRLITGQANCHAGSLVGATYVVEGVGGAEGHLRVIAHYVVLPGGRRVNIPALRLVGPVPPLKSGS